MLTNRFWLIPAAALFMAVLFIAPAVTVHATPAKDPGDVSDSCLTCHEQLYYLHDSGDWYCIAEHQNRCTNSHEGDQTDATEAGAHLGMLAHPQADDGAKCRECHEQEFAEAYLVTFASISGFEEIIVPDPYTPHAEMQIGFVQNEETQPTNLPWLAFGFLFFGLWLFLVLRS